MCGPERWEFGSTEWCQFAGELGARLIAEANLDLAKFAWGFSAAYSNVPDRLLDFSGVAAALLDGAVEFARSNGAIALEGYPVEPRSDDMPGIYAWMGLASMFENAGFEEIARRSETRPLMRKVL